MSQQPEASIDVSPPGEVAGRRWKFWGTVAAVTAVALVVAVAGGLYWYDQRAPHQFALARQALATGQFDEVERRLAQLDGDTGYEPHRHFLRGALLLEQRQHLRALEEFGYAVDHPELRVDTLTLAGQAAYRAGQWQNAVGLLQQALELAPDSLPALRWLASSYYDLGLNDAAVATLLRIAELDPQDPRPHRLLGLMYKDFENYAAAVDFYRESLRRSQQQPDHNQILIELADCQINLQQHDPALETLSGCVPHPERWVREAECHYGQGRADVANALLQQALNEDPAHLAGLLLAGTIALERGDIDSAVEAFSRAVVAWPRDYTANFKLSQALRRAGRNEQADRVAQTADEIKRTREEFSGLHETAGEQPNNADVRCRLGILANQLGRPDLARVWFRAALAIDPAHAETLRQLAGEPPPATAPAEPPVDPAVPEPR
jgi:tetratricopeptide (TPR) repeat protein